MPETTKPGRSPLNILKSLLIFIGQLILLTFLFFLTKELWNGYNDAKRNELYQRQGTIVRITVKDVSNKRLDWKDNFTNSKYIIFSYKGKDYTLRYIQDTVFLQPGIQLNLLYDAPSDGFIQPGRFNPRKPMYKTSPLVSWNFFSLLSVPTLAFLSFCFVGGLFLMLSMSLLSKLSGLVILQKLASLIIAVCAIIGALYVSYDSWKYYSYYENLKSKAAQTEVIIEDLSKELRYKSNQRTDSFIIFYDYTAKVKFKGESRIVAVGEQDYETQKKGEQLKVLYDSSIDDMVSVRYGLAYETLVFPGILWIILFIILFNRKKIKNQ